MQYIMHNLLVKYADVFFSYVNLPMYETRSKRHHSEHVLSQLTWFQVDRPQWTCNSLTMAVMQKPETLKADF